MKTASGSSLARRALLAGAAGLAATPAALRAEAAWPREKQLHVIVPAPPGGVDDLLGRLLAERLNERLGANAAVQNRPGRAGLVGTSAVIQAAADGYTLLVSASDMAVLPLILKAATFDPEVDLTAMARMAAAPFVLVSTVKQPQRTVPEVLAAARANPRDWQLAGSRDPVHRLANMDFLRRAGGGIELWPYSGFGAALADIAAGNVQLLLGPSSATLPAVRDGRARALGIATRERSPLAPEVPTMIEQGIAGYEFSSWHGVWGPKGVPEAIVMKVNALVREAAGEPGVAARLRQAALEPVAEPPEATRRRIASDIARARELFGSANVTPE